MTRPHTKLGDSRWGDLVAKCRDRLKRLQDVMGETRKENEMVSRGRPTFAGMTGEGAGMTGGGVGAAGAPVSGPDGVNGRSAVDGNNQSSLKPDGPGLETGAAKPPAKPVGWDRRTVEVKGRESLDPAEVPGLQEKIKERWQARAALNEKLAEVAAKLKLAKVEVAEVSKEIEADMSYLATGSRPANVKAIERRDYKTGRKTITDQRTGEVYTDVELSAWDRQRRLEDRNFRTDCYYCKYFGCQAPAPGEVGACGWADCSECGWRVCGFCRACGIRNKLDCNGVDNEEQKVAPEKRDCFFCSCHGTLSGCKDCRRQEDCHGCPHFKCMCVPGFSVNEKTGLCRVGSKVPTGLQLSSRGEASPGGKGERMHGDDPND